MTQDSLEMTEPLAPRHLLAAIIYAGRETCGTGEALRAADEILLSPSDPIRIRLRAATAGVGNLIPPGNGAAPGDA